MRPRTIAAGALALFIAAASAVVAVRRQNSTADVAVATPLPRESPSASTDTPGSITLDSRRQQLIGVRTATARRKTMSADIRATAVIVYDETRLSEINTRVDGWIRDLYADFTGRSIKRGEPLFTLYSQDLIATQNEYLLALGGQSHVHDPGPNVERYETRLVEAARERLLRFDLSNEDIDRVRDTGQPIETVTFRSPVSGIIIEKPAVRGMRVVAGQTLYRVADLSAVWVEAEIYESDLSAVRMGEGATVSVEAYPERTFPGRVTYIAPTVSPETRTVRVRIALANTHGLLKPNMTATVALSGATADAIVVPPDAVVDTGTRHVVFLANGEGRFTPRDVRVGRRSADEVEILSGLDEGDEVAASATFFLDSESGLRNALQSYSGPAGTPAAQAAQPAIEISFRSATESPKAGDVPLIVTVKDAEGKPIGGADVAIHMFMAAMPSMNMPAHSVHARLVDAGAGLYRGSAEVISAGRWDATVSVTKEGRNVATRQFALMVQ